MDKQNIVEIEINHEVVFKHFSKALLHPIINPEDPKGRTIENRKLYISEVYYDFVSQLTSRIGLYKINNEICFIVQLLRILKAREDNKRSSVKIAEEIISDLRVGRNMYEFLDSEEYTVSELVIKFKSSTTSKESTLKITEDFTLSLIQDKLKKKIRSEIQILSAFESYFSNSLHTREYIDNIKKLSLIIFNFLRDTTDLKKNRIYSLIVILYDISTAHDFHAYQSDTTDLIKKWISRAKE